MTARKGSFSFGRLKLALKKISPGRRPGERHEAHAFFEVAVAAQKGQSFLDEGLRVKGDQVRLVPVDALVIGGIDSSSFLGIEREIAEALAGAHLSGAQN